MQIAICECTRGRVALFLTRVLDDFKKEMAETFEIPSIDHHALFADIELWVTHQTGMMESKTFGLCLIGGQMVNTLQPAMFGIYKNAEEGRKCLLARLERDLEQIKAEKAKAEKEKEKEDAKDQPADLPGGMSP